MGKHIVSVTNYGNIKTLRRFWMRNLLKFIGIAALTTIIGFSTATCGDGGGDGLPTAGNGFIDLSTGKNFQVYDRDTGNASTKSITFTHFSHGEALSDCFYPGTYEVKMTGGKLSLKLGTLKPEKLIDVSSSAPPGLSCTNGLKIFAVAGFVDGDSLWPDHTLLWGEGVHEVDFYYANKQGTISGKTFVEDAANPPGRYHIYNCDFKQGWNTVLSYYNALYDSLWVTGTPGANQKWRLSN